MRRPSVLGALAVCAAAAAAVLAPASVAQAAPSGQIEIARSTIGLYDPITVRFPGCTADALGGGVVASWERDLYVGSWDRGLQGYESVPGTGSSSLDSATEPAAYKLAHGYTFTITGECEVFSGPNTGVYPWGSATVTVTYPASVVASREEWSFITGHNVLSSRPDGTGYRAVFQDDGNFVVYAPDRRPLWSSRTFDTYAMASLLEDGNFVIHTADPSTGLNPRTIFESRTAGNPGARLTMQGDGNLVLYSAANKPLWWTGVDPRAVTGPQLRVGQELVRGTSITSTDGRFRLSLQTDGNLVLYRGTRPLWTTDTRSGSRFVLQGDGNVVLYDAANRPLWSAGVRPGADRLVVQNDGNLVLYNTANKPLWATMTRG